MRLLFPAEFVPGYASLITLVAFLGGTQLVCLGVVGEYVGRIYEETKGRPLYLVRGIYPAGPSKSQEGSGA